MALRAIAFQATPCGWSACVLAIGMIASTLIAVLHGPLERLHAAERAAGDGGQPRDPELIQERALGPHHVGDRDDRKVGPVGPARCRVRGRRSRRAAAASEQIRADDEEPVGVERLAGADHAVPPAQAPAAAGVALVGAEAVPGALRGRRRREAGRVGVAAQRVADQNDVVPRRRQRPVGLVGDADRMQLASTVERERLRKVEELRVDRADGARGGLRRWRGHAGDHIPCGLESMGTDSSAALVTADRRVPLYDSKLARRGSARPLTVIEGAHDGRVECQQRRQRRGIAGGAGSTERRAAGGQVHVAGLLQVAERHAQPTRRSQGFHGLGEEQKHKTEFSFEADHPEIFASEDLGATPVELRPRRSGELPDGWRRRGRAESGHPARSVEAKLEGSMDIQGILGIDSDVRNGYDDIKVTFHIDADASKKEIEAIVAQSQKRSAVFDIITNPTNVTRRGRLAPAAASERSSPSNTSRRSSSEPGTPDWRRAAASPSARSITWCSSAARWRTPGAANAGTRCGC